MSSPNPRKRREADIDLQPASQLALVNKVQSNFPCNCAFMVSDKGNGRKKFNQIFIYFQIHQR